MRYPRRIHRLAASISMQNEKCSRDAKIVSNKARKSKHIMCTQIIPRIRKSWDEMCVCHDTCTPYTPATNGRAERAVRRVKEGTGSLLVQSGFPDRWWHKAMAALCFLRNVHDIQPCGKTAYELRYGEPFYGPMIAFGASAM